MNTAKLKAYAPQARKDFIKAVTERANYYGIFSDDHIEPIKFKGDVAIVGERAFTKKEGELREKLVNRIKRDRFELVMRACAYTWFNRFVALRYMELHNYLDHGYRVLSNNSASDIPEILEHAADVDFQGLDKDKVVELRLAGNKDDELYQLLIVAQCNALHRTMPFLFDKIDSETELLLPDNLLHSDSSIRKMVNEIDEEDWNDVEIIGWIYQFYISERKDEVIGKVVKSEDIPAATQLFTPNWIVKYMVQNTLGRMWLATYPDSTLKEKMVYYIEPVEQEPQVQEQLDSITPKELHPEEITFFDPACGSGHILVEAYDILKEIYLERGYRTKDIPRLILEKNLYGLDIDDRAGQLACFAVLMRARRDDRRILNRDDLNLNVMAIQSAKPSDVRNIEIFFKGNEYNVIRSNLNELFMVFEKGKTFGSLITVPDNLSGRISDIEKITEDKIGKWIWQSGAQNLVALVKQARILARNFDCVVMNPPYMGTKGMNPMLKDFAKGRFPSSKSDLFAMFIERALELSGKHRFVGMITMQSWMFLSSFEKLRENILNLKTLLSMIHLGARAFDSIGGEVVSTTAFILANVQHPKYKGGYIRLVDGKSESEKRIELRHCISQSKAINQKSNFHLASTADFNKIPGSPIAYWVSEQTRNCFERNAFLAEFAFSDGKNITGNNDKYQRFFWEVSAPTVGRQARWVFISKGGGFKKWIETKDITIDWSNDARRHYRKNPIGRVISEYIWFRNGITWGLIASSLPSFRVLTEDFTFSDVGLFFNDEKHIAPVLAFLNSKVSYYFLNLLNPTMNFPMEVVLKLPVSNILGLTWGSSINSEINAMSSKIIQQTETSWEFTIFPLLQKDYKKSTVEETYLQLRTYWREIILAIQLLEEKNNYTFIKAYELQDDLTPEVPLDEITLTCNPSYRYGGEKGEEELEALLLGDTMKELISYAIGCMMGRYSLDHPSLIYADSGNIGFDSSKYKTFPTDDDGIIPIMDQDWFPDDATKRFVEFIKVAWSPEALDENLKFIADSLKPRGKEEPINSIRRYLSTNFFKDHLKTYKKRPIYWLFSSGKQKAFECLVYLHRYNESTLSRIRSTYVTPLQGNISARLEFLQNEKDAAASASAQRKFQKEIDVLRKKQTELSAFDDELRHYADMKISLDLDDGVKVNYSKFGNLLPEKKAVTGKK